MSEEKLSITVHRFVFKEEQSGGFFCDPAIFVKVDYYGEIFRSKTVYGKAELPKFNDTFDLGNGRKDEKIRVSVYSEGCFSNDFIGEVNVYFDSLKVEGGTKDGFTVLKNGSSLGVIFLESHYTKGE